MDDLESDAWRRPVALLPASLDAELQQDGGMTHHEFGVLSLLRFAPDATVQATDLATRTNATLPRLPHVLSRMAERGRPRRASA